VAKIILPVYEDPCPTKLHLGEILRLSAQNTERIRIVSMDGSVSEARHWKIYNNIPGFFLLCAAHWQRVRDALIWVQVKVIVMRSTNRRRNEHEKASR
jgi:hypothetical protein